jgi:hypothetical protein
MESGTFNFQHSLEELLLIDGEFLYYLTLGTSAMRLSGLVACHVPA